MKVSCSERSVCIICSFVKLRKWKWKWKNTFIFDRLRLDDGPATSTRIRDNSAFTVIDVPGIHPFLKRNHRLVYKKKPGTYLSSLRTDCETNVNSENVDDPSSQVICCLVYPQACVEVGNVCLSIHPVHLHILVCGRTWGTLCLSGRTVSWSNPSTPLYQYTYEELFIGRKARMNHNIGLTIRGRDEKRSIPGCSSRKRVLHPKQLESDAHLSSDDCIEENQMSNESSIMEKGNQEGMFVTG